MFPTAIAGHCAISHRGAIEFPDTAGWRRRTQTEDCVRVILRGGFYFDTPASTVIHLAHESLPVTQLRAGTMLPAPCLLPCPGVSEMPYDYTASNNAGNPVRYAGNHVVTEAQAELLGWILGSESLHNGHQSIRFTSADRDRVHRVQELSAAAFPDVHANVYDKDGAYDLTLTGGINNPVRHFVRMVDFYEGCPMAVGRHFDLICLRAFLRGVWGAQGWVYPRKDGDDILFGLNRIHNEYLFSWMRLVHAGIGLQGSRETSKEGAFRLIFNGFRNYRVFISEIGPFGTGDIPALPERKALPMPPTHLANGGELWYDAPVIKVTQAGHLPVFEQTADLPAKRVNTEHSCPVASPATSPGSADANRDLSPTDQPRGPMSQSTIATSKDELLVHLAHHIAQLTMQDLSSIMTATGLPFDLLHEFTTGQKSIDDDACCKLLVHLMESGHAHIAFITTEHSSAARRQNKPAASAEPTGGQGPESFSLASITAFPQSEIAADVEILADTKHIVVADQDRRCELRTVPARFAEKLHGHFGLPKQSCYTRDDDVLLIFAVVRCFPDDVLPTKWRRFFEKMRAVGLRNGMKHERLDAILRIGKPAKDDPGSSQQP